jgi:hypothetical protein
MAEKKKKTTADKVVGFFADKPIPGGPSSTAFQHVIQTLREVIGTADKQKKKKQKTAAEKLFGN